MSARLLGACSVDELLDVLTKDVATRKRPSHEAIVKMQLADVIADVVHDVNVVVKPTGVFLAGEEVRVERRSQVISKSSSLRDVVGQHVAKMRRVLVPR